MKCPNCGNEMKEGMLYCEVCGEDIHIVPDFVPEVENNIEEAINTIVEELGDKSNTNNSTKNDQVKVSNKYIKICTIICLFVLLSIILIWGIITYRDSSYDVQLSLANKAYNNSDYLKAIDYYKKAINLSKDNKDYALQISIADAYSNLGNIADYIVQLNMIINDYKLDEDTAEQIYASLISFYVANEQFDIISDLLSSCEFKSIVDSYEEYIANKPEFSIQSGFYSKIQPLKISSVGNGKIYYTLDETEPTQDSDEYIVPIILEEGEYIIKAVFINEYGIKSEVQTAEFNIHLDYLDPPQVSTVSGDYFIPNQIVIENNPDNIYYTMDGSDPTVNSKVYVSPIDMPLGKSFFKFKRINGDRESEIIERRFNLDLKTEYKVENAQEELKKYLLDTGYIVSLDGSYDDSGSIYVYEYLMVKIIGKDYYYIFAEVNRDVDGNQVRSGNYYAANVYDGTLYYLNIDVNSNYTLVDI